MKRRDLIIGVGLAASAMPLLGRASEDNKGEGEMVPGSDAETELLFVQNATSASLSGGAGYCFPACMRGQSGPPHQGTSAQSRHC